MTCLAIGAATVPFNEIQAHTIGPKIADDGTPAGQPYAHTTGMMTVVRVDDVTDPDRPTPYANWITLGLHPEWTWGYDLFSGDITHAAMRIMAGWTHGTAFPLPTITIRITWASAPCA